VNGTTAPAGRHDLQAREGLDRRSRRPQTLAALETAVPPKPVASVRDTGSRCSAARGHALFDGDDVVRAIHVKGAPGYETNAACSRCSARSGTRGRTCTRWLLWASYFDGGIAFHEYKDARASRFTVASESRHPEAPFVYEFGRWALRGGLLSAEVSDRGTDGWTDTVDRPVRIATVATPERLLRRAGGAGAGVWSRQRRPSGVDCSSNLANTQVLVDATSFAQWVNAYAHGQTALAQFYFRRFRPAFAGGERMDCDRPVAGTRRLHSHRLRCLNIGSPQSTKRRRWR
jgi:hypothetical protein